MDWYVNSHPNTIYNCSKIPSSNHSYSTVLSFHQECGEIGRSSLAKQFSNDGLHPNLLGNKHFANVVAAALVKVYGDDILKRH